APRVPRQNRTDGLALGDDATAASRGHAVLPRDRLSAGSVPAEESPAVANLALAVLQGATEFQRLQVSQVVGAVLHQLIQGAQQVGTLLRASVLPFGLRLRSVVHRL